MSVTLPALQQGKGKRCEGGLTPKWEKESAAVNVLPKYLWFSVTVAPHYINEFQKKKKKLDLRCAALQKQDRACCIRLQTHRPVDEFDVEIAILGFKQSQLMRGFCLYCHIISWDVMS